MRFVETTYWVAYLEVRRATQGLNNSQLRCVVPEEEVQAVLAMAQPRSHLIIIYCFLRVWQYIQQQINENISPCVHMNCRNNCVQCPLSRRSARVFVVYKHICDGAPNLQLRQHLFVHLKGKFLIPYHVGINNAAPQNCVVQLDRHFRGGLCGCLLRTSPPDYPAFAFHPESSTVSFSSHTLVWTDGNQGVFFTKNHAFAR